MALEGCGGERAPPCGGSVAPSPAAHPTFRRRRLCPAALPSLRPLPALATSHFRRAQNKPPSPAPPLCHPPAALATAHPRLPSPHRPQGPRKTPPQPTRGGRGTGEETRAKGEEPARTPPRPRPASPGPAPPALASPPRHKGPRWGKPRGAFSAERGPGRPSRREGKAGWTAGRHRAPRGCGRGGARGRCLRRGLPGGGGGGARLPFISRQRGAGARAPRPAGNVPSPARLPGNGTKGEPRAGPGGGVSSPAAAPGPLREPREPQFPPRSAATAAAGLRGDGGRGPRPGGLRAAPHRPPPLPETRPCGAGEQRPLRGAAVHPDFKNVKHHVEDVKYFSPQCVWKTALAAAASPC